MIAAPVSSSSPHATLLRVESDLVIHAADQPPSAGRRLTYRPPARPWQRVEALLRMRVHLARQVKRAEPACDIVWAGNEGIGIPLAFMGLRNPLVVIAHHMESRAKALFARLSGVVQRWDGIGYHSDEDKRFFMDRLHVPAERLFPYESAKYLSRATPVESASGPIMSAGVSKRDYGTLVAALANLPECDTEIYAYSRYGDCLDRRVHPGKYEWIRFMRPVDEETLLQVYRQARFVVVPLQRTRQHGAGMTAVLEASALGKAVIATHTRGMATFVKDGETGLLVAPYDVPALRRAIHRLWSDPALAQRLGAAGQRYMRQRFDPAVVDDNIIRFLDKLREKGTRR